MIAAQVIRVLAWHHPEGHANPGNIDLLAINTKGYVVIPATDPRPPPSAHLRPSRGAIFILRAGLPSSADTLHGDSTPGLEATAQLVQPFTSGRGDG